MRFLITFIYAALAVIFLASCSNDRAKNQNKTDIGSASAFDLDPRLKDSDSLVVVFYKDPYGEDSLRYTRYYTQIPVTDPEEMRFFQKELVQTFKGQEKRRNCRGEGKIWCFSGKKIFQTLYFSTQCDDCCYLYLIKDGNFYYSRLSLSMRSWLEKLKPLSTEPTNGGIEE